MIDIFLQNYGVLLGGLAGVLGQLPIILLPSRDIAWHFVTVAALPLGLSTAGGIIVLGALLLIDPSQEPRLSSGLKGLPAVAGAGFKRAVRAHEFDVAELAIVTERSWGPSIRTAMSYRKATGRPVKFIEDRRENLMSAGQSRHVDGTVAQYQAGRRRLASPAVPGRGGRRRAAATASRRRADRPTAGRRPTTSPGPPSTGSTA